MERLSQLVADALSDTLNRLIDLAPLKQDDNLATLAPIMSKEDGKFDWSMRADKIARRVRGFQPFPTTFTIWEGKKLTIWKARAVEEGVGEPGEVLAARGDDLLVACGGGTGLKIEELQLEGKRRMIARDFLNGVKWAQGESLK